MSQLVMPSVCPQCRSTAVISSGIRASCYMCGWKGREKELLTLVSEGLSLDDALDRFAIDLTHVVAATTSVPLRDFLLRWGVVAEDDTKALRFMIGISCQHITGSVMNYLTKIGEAVAREHGEEEPESATGPVVLDIEQPKRGKRR